MARYAGGFGLYGLSTPYLQIVDGGKRVEGHVLCLEGGGRITVLPEYAAECGGDDTLAYIASRSGKHDVS